MAYTLSNAEMVLLLLMAEQGAVTGYAMRNIVEERGYRAWAGVGTTSIYNGLKRLESRRLTESSADIEKHTRGPQGRIYSLTPEGRSLLVEEVRTGLRTTREHDPRFNIALSGMALLEPDEVHACLHTRLAFLDSESRRLAGMRDDLDEEAPLAAWLLFDRSIHAIDSEQKWVRRAIAQIEAPDAQGARTS